MDKKDHHLMSPDLMPIPHREKKISTLGFSFMWVGMAVVLAAFAIGGAGFSQYHLWQSFSGLCLELYLLD